MGTLQKNYPFRGRISSVIWTSLLRCADWPKRNRSRQGRWRWPGCWRKGRMSCLFRAPSEGCIWSRMPRPMPSPFHCRHQQRDRALQTDRAKVLFAVDGYQYNGKALDRRSVLSELQQALPTLQKTVLIPYLFKETETEGEVSTVVWQDLLSNFAVQSSQPSVCAATIDLKSCPNVSPSV